MSDGRNVERRDHGQWIADIDMNVKARDRITI